MRVLVTGGSGFIGSHVVSALINSGHQILCLLLPTANLRRLEGLPDKIEILRGDVTKVRDFQAELFDWRPEACVHLAWYAEPGKYLRSDENLPSLKGSLDLLQVLAVCGCGNFIGAGTCAEYREKSGKLLETDPTGPETLYAASKLSFQVIGEQLAKQYKIRFSWGRIFSLYGPYEDVRRLVPAAILKLQSDEIFRSSAGEQVRDYLHVTDVARAFVALLNHESSGIYNICSSEPITIKNLLNTIAGLMGKTELLAFGSLPGRGWDPSFLCGNNDRLRSLGWSPQINLLAGLQDTINWWKHHMETKL